MQTSIQSKRDLTADIAKGIGIILVLIGHTPTNMTTWIYAVHMPLFVFISGWFYKKRSERKNFQKDIKG